MTGEAIVNKSFLKKFALNKTVLRDVPAPTAPASAMPAAHEPIDRWRAVRAWWKRIRRLGQRAPRRLRLCDSLPLGERRFVAVVEFERSRFLVGGTTSSLVLLASLGTGQDRDDQNRRNQNEKKGEDEIAAPARPPSEVFEVGP